jgi:hypothetical protein
MSNLIRRIAQPVQPDPLLSAQIADAQTPGLVTAGRLQSVGLAATVAIQQAETLQLAVHRAFELNPAGDHVYKAIFLAYGSVATAEIQRLGMYQGGRF